MDTLQYILDRFNVDVTQQSPIELPLAREDLPAFFHELGFKVGAEIGVRRGDYSVEFCKAIPNLEFYAVDCWVPHPEFHHKGSRITQHYVAAQERLLPYNCMIIKKFSIDAVREFEDESLDFVYIDANHRFEYVVEDLLEWGKKVKKNGIISGHDYCTFHKPEDNGTVNALNLFTFHNNIRPWFVFDQLTQDNPQSWMLVKCREQWR